MAVNQSPNSISEFDYLIEKIENTEFKQKPFKHLEIKDFLSEEHFRKITNSDQIQLPKFKNDGDLIDGLESAGYVPVPFAGVTDSVDEYLSWRKGKTEHTNNDTTAGFGMTFRLERYDNPTINGLFQFFNSEEFIDCISEKFGLDPSRFRDDVSSKTGRKKTGLDTGLQKYLDGYEISPHPDTRRKALTFMLNINSHNESEQLDFHTDYMNLVDKRKYVEKYWEHNTHYDRCWIPWEWCETVKKQTENNSIVFFAPSDDTIHAIKAEYNHLKTQRTQFYGNFWYKDNDCVGKPSWDKFVIESESEKPLINRDVANRKMRRLRNGLASKLPI